MLWWLGGVLWMMILLDISSTSLISYDNKWIIVAMQQLFGTVLDYWIADSKTLWYTIHRPISLTKGWIIHYPHECFKVDVISLESIFNEIHNIEYSFVLCFDFDDSTLVIKTSLILFCFFTAWSKVFHLEQLLPGRQVSKSICHFGQ